MPTVLTDIFFKAKAGALLIHLRRKQSKITWSLLQITDKYSLVTLICFSIKQN